MQLIARHQILHLVPSGSRKSQHLSNTFLYIFLMSLLFLLCKFNDLLIIRTMLTFHCCTFSWLANTISYPLFLLSTSWNWSHIKSNPSKILTPESLNTEKRRQPRSNTLLLSIVVIAKNGPTKAFKVLLNIPDRCCY